MLLRACASITQFAVVMLSTAIAAAQVPVTDCDRLAAHPLDRNAVAAGAFATELDVARARASCEEALAAYPDTPRFHFQLARTHFVEGRLDPGAAHLQSAADAGYPAAMDLFSTLLERVNAGAAQTWLHRAAEGGHPSSMSRLCRAYARGDQVEQDLDTAIGWCRRAVEARDRIGMILLAEHYKSGNGVERDPKEAARLYRLGADVELRIARTYPNQVQYVDWAGWGIVFANELDMDLATIDPMVAELDAVLARDWVVAPDIRQSADELRIEMHDVKAHLMAQKGDVEAALAAYRVVLDASTERTQRVQSTLSGMDLFEGETDGVVTEALISALEACLRKGNCYP